jgi:hypothetical protein
MKDNWRTCETEDVIVKPLPLTPDYAWMATSTLEYRPKRLGAPKVRRKRLKKKVQNAKVYKTGPYRKIYIQVED